MAVITPLNYDETLGKDKVVLVYSDAPDNLHAIFEIDDWARAHGYVRSRERSLNVKQDANRQRYYYSACYLLDEADLHAANSDLARMNQRRDQMAMTVPAADLLREEA